MRSGPIFFPVYRTVGGNPRLTGNSFSVTHENVLVTCAHITENPSGLAVLCRNSGDLVPVRVSVPLPGLDIAFLEPERRIWPKARIAFLPNEFVRLGEDVYTFGRAADFAPDPFSGANDLYLKGHLVRHSAIQEASHGGNTVSLQFLSASFAAVEGISGSPTMTYHNGPKCVGLIIGNDQSRMLAHEVYSYEGDEVVEKETVNRIVEFARIYAGAIVYTLLLAAGVTDVLYTAEHFEDACLR